MNIINNKAPLATGFKNSIKTSFLSVVSPALFALFFVILYGNNISVRNNLSFQPRQDTNYDLFRANTRNNKRGSSYTAP